MLNDVTVNYFALIEGTVVLWKNGKEGGGDGIWTSISLVGFAKKVFLLPANNNNLKRYRTLSGQLFFLSFKLNCPHFCIYINP